MTRVLWTATAVSDLEQIANYLGERTPAHSARIVRAIYELVDSLHYSPSRGRAGRKPGTRELVASKLPYVLIYRLRSDDVRLLRILHGAQKWP